MSSKIRLLVLTLCLVVVAVFAVATENVQSASSGQTAVSACARCGDGVCARSCENEFSCPRDCGPTP